MKYVFNPSSPLPAFAHKLLKLSELWARHRAHLPLQVYQFPQAYLTCVWFA